MTTIEITPQSIASFEAWTHTARENGLSPIIYVVGTRGKSTIVRLLDAMARASGLRTAVRTDAGVEIEGRRQLGDIHPLRESLEELDAGDLDLAIIEMGWGDIHTLPVSDRHPAAVVISTICPHKDYCLLEDTRRAIGGLMALLLATPSSTLIATDLDDSAYPSLADLDLGNLLLSTASREHPGLTRHLQTGGVGAWSSDESMIVGTSNQTYLNVAMNDIPLTMNGAALFQMRNVMLASAIGTAIGLPPEAVHAGITQVKPENSHLPTSLNSFTADGVRVIIDRPSPPWFLSPLLRTVRAMKPGRVFFVLDYRDVASQDDTVEVGRMVGRNAAMCIVINEHMSLASVVALKAGIAQNEITPPVVHTESLPKAVLRALGSAKPDDLVVVLTARPQTVYRTLARHRPT